MNLTMLLILIYIIGLLIWIKIENKYFPYEEEEYTIEFDGAHEITPEMHECDSIARSILWPISLSFIIIMSPIIIISMIYKKL
jgi:Ca2+/H+ antiporter